MIFLRNPVLSFVVTCNPYINLKISFENLTFKIDNFIHRYL